MSNIHPFFIYLLYPTPSWLSRAAARSRCHHLFLYFPHLGCWNRSWLSFLADSVISARPQLGEVPRPTGDPCSCKAAGRRKAVRGGDGAPERLPGPAPSCCIINAPSPTPHTEQKICAEQLSCRENGNKESWKNVGCVSAEMRSLLGRDCGWSLVRNRGRIVLASVQ